VIFNLDVKVNMGGGKVPDVEMYMHAVYVHHDGTYISGNLKV
jgi:hypothetical protein